MVFPDYYFFAERRLVNHTIDEKRVKNLDDCELFCYLNDDCVSLNYKKDPENDKTGYNCQLNNATHLKYDSDLTTDAKFYYRGSKNACDKSPQCQNNATCQSGFTFKGYRCLCPPGYKGEHCEKDIDECETNPHKCHEEAACNNTHGSYSCSCKPGFIGDGHNCTGTVNTNPCYYHQNLSDASRNSSYVTPYSQEVCDDKLFKGWYRFVGAAGKKMPTTRVPRQRCGTVYSGWLNGAHPTMEDGEVRRSVCFSDGYAGCKHSTYIFVKNCGSYFIYKLFPPTCFSRYCGTV
ncbi:unnamed protein product [Pocillopora meandrina]|uniref:EGF-like domain-containing protein n=1 Tax=Pocillopora meandrina TaxID=46732 RepID=A0AAU9Y1Z6_9CNID|nr:unnamed protein product [Pocillopora meandrina]